MLEIAPRPDQLQLDFKPPGISMMTVEQYSALRLHLKRPHAYHPIPHLDPALRARLQSALQRPDLKPSTRAKIESALKQQ